MTNKSIQSKASNKSGASQSSGLTMTQMRLTKEEIEKDLSGEGRFDANAFIKMEKGGLPIDVSAVDIFSLTRHGRLTQVKQLLDLGVDPNSKDKYGNTLLIVAA